VTLFKLDENVPARVADALRRAGHDVHTVLDQALGGAPDQTVFAASAAEGRVLVTLDLDFADIRRQGVAQSPGILVVRVGRQDAGTVCAAILATLPAIVQESPLGSIWIIEPHRIRVWRPDR
jgi:predicted nuclease of predicted toxin-antitoxin system